MQKENSDEVIDAERRFVETQLQRGDVEPV
jgi:hypothetical protein